MLMNYLNTISEEGKTSLGALRTEAVHVQTTLHPTPLSKPFPFLEYPPFRVFSWPTRARNFDRRRCRTIDVGLTSRASYDTKRRPNGKGASITSSRISIHHRSYPLISRGSNEGGRRRHCWQTLLHPSFVAGQLPYAQLAWAIQTKKKSKLAEAVIFAALAKANLVMAKSQVARPLTLLRHSSSLHSTGSMLLMFRWPFAHAPSHGTLRASSLAYTTSGFSSDYTHRPTFPLSARTQSYTPTSAACPDGRSQIVHVLSTYPPKCR
ncbi:hypothetical protein D9613_012900 [Agrocybe pediades]|uniref:Uncharacterized protein n=1 Tax=Agrocybe pediades TaxID=84607 RepID=A0A8H4VLY0_9AGAR|nr:hypothetical protein D9613_012900 [Agrocybe pediades]